MRRNLFYSRTRERFITVGEFRLGRGEEQEEKRRWLRAVVTGGGNKAPTVERRRALKRGKVLVNNGNNDDGAVEKYARRERDSTTLSRRKAVFHFLVRETSRHNRASFVSLTLSVSCARGREENSTDRVVNSRRRGRAVERHEAAE